MDLVIQILAVILGIAGLLGCILPVLPGPPLSFIGLVLLFLKAKAPWPGPFCYCGALSPL